MSPRALTAPPDDRSMWRRVLARVHPDAPGGDHELFIWTGAVRDFVCGKSSSRNEDSPRSHEDPARVPFDPSADFSELNRRALALASELPEAYGCLLELAAECEPPPMQTGAWQLRGASYKRLAAIGHTLGMTKPERVRWYRIAEAVPLSDRHAWHILDRIKRAA